jgi:hypothetical protein
MMMLALLLQATDSLGHPEMTAGGWAFFAGAWIFILGLVIFTFSKVLGNHGKNK